MFGNPMSRGSFIVNLVLAGCAATTQISPLLEGLRADG
jgi:hypothetical protein